jgi:hypothetical protein
MRFHISPERITLILCQTYRARRPAHDYARPHPCEQSRTQPRTSRANTADNKALQSPAKGPCTVMWRESPDFYSPSVTPVMRNRPGIISKFYCGCPQEKSETTLDPDSSLSRTDATRGHVHRVTDADSPNREKCIHNTAPRDDAGELNFPEPDANSKTCLRFSLVNFKYF